MVIVPSVTKKVQIRTKESASELTDPIVTFKSSGRSWEHMAGCSEVRREVVKAASL